eukprot:scaffold435303_cov42-Prasinocladus_malaysianus.AAC.2
MKRSGGHTANRRTYETPAAPLCRHVHSLFTASSDITFSRCDCSLESRKHHWLPKCFYAGPGEQCLQVAVVITCLNKRLYGTPRPTVKRANRSASRVGVPLLASARTQRPPPR